MSNRALSENVAALAAGRLAHVRDLRAEIAGCPLTNPMRTLAEHRKIVARLLTDLVADNRVMPMPYISDDEAADECLCGVIACLLSGLHNAYVRLNGVLFDDRDDWFLPQISKLDLSIT